MTAQDFIANGYKVSLQISQGEIDRAVTDVTAAYVDKVTTYNTTAMAKAAIMQLAFILLCQRNTFATRAGGKMKLSPQLSDNAQARQTDYDNADRLLVNCKPPRVASLARLTRWSTTSAWSI